MKKLQAVLLGAVVLSAAAIIRGNTGVRVRRLRS